MSEGRPRLGKKMIGLARLDRTSEESYRLLVLSIETGKTQRERADIDMEQQSVYEPNHRAQLSRRQESYNHGIVTGDLGSGESTYKSDLQIHPPSLLPHRNHFSTSSSNGLLLYSFNIITITLPRGPLPATRYHHSHIP
jgi:hypothetical protein